MLGVVGYHMGTGDVQTAAAIVTCPACSFLSNGSCVVCQTSDEHPGCDGCRDGVVIWYRRPLFVSVVTAVSVSLLVGVIVKQVKTHTKLFSD